MNDDKNYNLYELERVYFERVYAAVIAANPCMALPAMEKESSREVERIIFEAFANAAGEIVRRVLTVANPDRIILFGSAATGQMTRDSDIDLLIVEPEAANRHEESVKIRSAIGDISFPVDVIVINTERFEATKDIFGGIAYPAHKYGRVLYEVA